MLSILAPQFRTGTARRRRASERMARYRSRLRANEIVAPVVVTHPIIELLISAGSLDVGNPKIETPSARRLAQRFVTLHREPNGVVHEDRRRTEAVAR